METKVFPSFVYELNILQNCTTVSRHKHIDVRLS
jgi:hypothetical protein